MVQTIGSAGESLAAGAIFTMPALFLWAEEGKIAMPGYLEITLIALFGGILGVLFMIPLRKALIVEEHGTLPYPEGMACAEVLLAGEDEENIPLTIMQSVSELLIDDENIMKAFRKGRRTEAVARLEIGLEKKTRAIVSERLK